MCARSVHAHVRAIRLKEAVTFTALTLSLVLGANPGCPHPYFPMEAGLKLTYRAGKSEIFYGVNSVTPIEDGLSGELEVRFKSRVGRTEVRCTKDGIVSELGGIEGIAIQAAGMNAKVLDSEGPFMPPPDQMKPGDSWKNRIELELAPPANVKLPAGMKIRTAFSKEATVVGEEKVTVRAGTFKALKLLNKTTASSGSAGSERAVESFIWVAPDVGIIKIQTGDTVDLELLNIERPAKAEKTPAKRKQAG